MATGRVPRGVFNKVADDLNLSNPSVSRIWKYFVANNSLVRMDKQPVKRLLSQEDEDYVRDLVQMKPTLYKKEICDLVLRNTNTPITDISLSTIYRTVCHRICSIQFTMKKTQRSNERRWIDANIIYTRNFFTFMQTVDPFPCSFCRRGEREFCDNFSNVWLFPIWIKSGGYFYSQTRE